MIDQEKIHNQCLSEDPKERIKALNQLNNSFSSLPDREQAWKDLHKLTENEDHLVRSDAAYSLGSVFPYVYNKEQAWKDLIILEMTKVAICEVLLLTSVSLIRSLLMSLIKNRRGNI